MKKTIYIFCVLLILSSALYASTAIKYSNQDFIVKSITVETNDVNGQQSFEIYGQLAQRSVKTIGADGNDSNGVDVTIYDESDNVISADVNVVGGVKKAITITDMNDNPYGTIYVAGIVDVNWQYNNAHEPNGLRITLWCESQKDPNLLVTLNKIRADVNSLEGKFDGYLADSNRIDPNVTINSELVISRIEPNAITPQSFSPESRPWILHKSVSENIYVE